MAELHVELVAVEEMIFSGEAELVRARTLEGELGVLPGHIPLLGQLVDPGEVIIRTRDGDKTFIVHGGFLSVDSDGVSILAETAEPAEVSTASTTN